MKSTVFLFVVAVFLRAQFVLAGGWRDDWPLIFDDTCAQCWPDPADFKPNSYAPHGLHPVLKKPCCEWEMTTTASDVYDMGEPPRVGSHRVNMLPPPFLGAPVRLARTLWGDVPNELVQENRARRLEMQKVRKAKRAAQRNKLPTYNMTADAAIQHLSYLSQKMQGEILGGVYAEVAKQLQVEKPFFDVVVNYLDTTGAPAQQTLPEWASGVIQPNGPVDGKGVMGSNGRLLLDLDWGNSNSTDFPSLFTMLNVTLDTVIDVLSHAPAPQPLMDDFHQAAEILKSKREAFKALEQTPIFPGEPFKMPLFRWFKFAMDAYPWEKTITDSSETAIQPLAQVAHNYEPPCEEATFRL